MSSGETGSRLPPPPAVRWPDPTGVRRANGQRAVWIVLGVLVGLVMLGGVVLFVAGEALFGSDPGTIDSYNREVLDTCDVPAGSRLVRSYVLPVVGQSATRLRTMSDVYASPLDADEVAAFYGLGGPGIWSSVSPERACKFGNRPSVLVLSLWIPERTTPLDPVTETEGVPTDPRDEFWAGSGAEVTDIVDVPAGTRSFLRLRMAQREVDGVFGLGPVNVPYGLDEGDSA